MGDHSRLQRFANERRQSLLTALAYMRDIDLLTDVTLICNNKYHPAHRVILAASSNYFRDIFKNKKKVSRINVHDVDEETFTSVLKFLYTGTLTLKDIEGLKLAKILSAFRGLNIHCLDNITSCALTHVVNIDNFYSMWDMVKELQLKESEAVVVKYVSSNLKEYCHSQYFPLLTLQQMICVLSCKHLVSGSSNIILEAVAMWGSYDQERRAKYLTSLLSLIGLTIDPKLRQELLNCELNSNFQPVQLLSEEASVSSGKIYETPVSLSYQPTSKESSINSCEVDSPIKVVSTFEEKSTSLQINNSNIDLNTVQKCQSKTKRQEVVIGEIESKSSVSFLTTASDKKFCLPSKEKTIIVADIPEDSSESDIFSLTPTIRGEKFNREIKLPKRFGNLERKSMMTLPPQKDISCTRETNSCLTLLSENSAVSKINRDTTHEDLASPEPNKTSSINLVNDYLLFTATSRFGIPVAQTYNPLTRQWSQMKRCLNLPLDAASNIHSNRCIYVVGGETAQGNKLKTAYLYNLEAQTIRKLAPMAVGRSEAGMTHLSGYIYVIGGRGEDNKPLACVEYYCSVKNQWEIVADMKQARIQPNVATADGVIYVVGGCTGDEFRVNTTCEYYNKGVNQWNEMCPISRLHTDSRLLIANHQERIYAIQCQKPDKLFFYLPRQNKWVHMETNPKVVRVMAFFSCSKSLWIEDRSGKIMKYEAGNNTWQLNTKVPTELIWPVNVYVVDFIDG